jgi:hypothetical protein
VAGTWNAGRSFENLLSTIQQHSISGVVRLKADARTGVAVDHVSA